MRIVAAVLALVMILPGSKIYSQTPVAKYWYFGAHYQIPSYPQPLSSRTVFARRIPGSAHIPLHLDPIGYYLQKGKVTLVGGVLQVDIDRYSDYGEYLQIENYQPGISLIHYMDEKVGTGLFLRADAGPAFLRIASRDQGTEKTSFGWGVLIGSGFAMTFRQYTTLVSVNYARKYFYDGTHSFFSFGLGMMFKKDR